MRRLHLLLIVITLAPASLAQVSQSNKVQDRLFLGFIEDATVADRQWWEVGVEVVDDAPGQVDATLVRGQVAVNPWPELEFGARMGFGDTDTPPGTQDGSGGTDLDLWGKYLLSKGGDSDFAVGAIVTVPTGDDTAGLGFDAFSGAAFGSLRHRLRDFDIAVNAGVRVNGNGRQLGLPKQNGETSPFVGAGIIFPVMKSLTLIGEARVEAERFDGSSSDARVTGGANWRVGRRGVVRGSVTLGLSDGAPDAIFQVGYASEF